MGSPAPPRLQQQCLLCLSLSLMLHVWCGMISASSLCEIGLSLYVRVSALS